MLAIIRNNAKSSRDRYSLRLRNNAQYGPLNAQRLVTSFITSDQPPRVRISDLRNRRKSPLLLLRRCFPQFFERCPATRESTRYESKAKDFLPWRKNNFRSAGKRFGTISRIICSFSRSLVIRRSIRGVSLRH